MQHAAGAVGFGGGVGLGGQGFGEGGEEGCPLAGEALVAGLGQDLVEEWGEAGAQAGGDTLDLGLGQAFGGSEGAVEFLGDHGEGAQAVALLAACGGVQRGYGLVEGGEEVLGHAVGEGEAALPWGKVFADFVFGDHLRHGVGDRGGGAQEGCDAGGGGWVAGVQQAVGS